MSTLTAPDGARIFYKDWGRGQPILFSHGWPLSADAWDNQLLFFGQSGFRVIAHDRRGHGRSDQTWHGNDINQYADDLALLIETLDLRDLILVGHSTGGGEVARYIGRHGSDRVAKVVLVGAVPPLMLQTPVNPEGTPMAAFDGIRSGVAGNRSQFFKDLAVPFYGLHCDEVESNAGLIDHFWLMSMQGGVKGQYESVAQRPVSAQDMQYPQRPTVARMREDLTLQSFIVVAQFFTERLRKLQQRFPIARHIPLRYHACT